MSLVSLQFEDAVAGEGFYRVPEGPSARVNRQVYRRERATTSWQRYTLPDTQLRLWASEMWLSETWVISIPMLAGRQRVCRAFLPHKKRSPVDGGLNGGFSRWFSWLTNENAARLIPLGPAGRSILLIFVLFSFASFGLGMFKRWATVPSIPLIARHKFATAGRYVRRVMSRTRKLSLPAGAPCYWRE